MTHNPRIFKIIALLTVTGLTGFITLKFIPQSKAINHLQGDSATDNNKPQVPISAYSYTSYISTYSPQINVRVGPGKNYGFKDTVSKNVEVILLNDTIGNNGSRWYYLQVAQNNVEGWVPEELLFIPPELRDRHDHPKTATDAPKAEDKTEILLNPQMRLEGDFALKSMYPNSRINVRHGPGTDHDVKYYGLSGDRVSLLQSSTVEDGYRWWEVSFVQSGVKGWMREDFIAIDEK